MGERQRGDIVGLDPQEGPGCDVCGWDEGIGHVVEGQYDRETRKNHLVIICDVCYRTDSGILARWDVFQVHDRGPEYAMLKAMSQHTNLILKEIRRAGSNSSSQ